MADRVTVIGYDGAPLSAAARGALASATLVAGGARHLEAVPVPETAERVVMGNVHVAARRISEHRGTAVVVASGDPGFFGIVRILRRPEYGLELEIVPAVSSVAHAFARAAMPWDDAKVVSAHGRELRRAVNVCRAYGKVAVLTGPGSGPAELGLMLRGVPRTFVVCENLGTEHEEVTMLAADMAADRTWSDPNVVIVVGPNPATSAPAGWIAGQRSDFPGPVRGWGLEEDAYAHTGAAMVRAEVRALALSRLGPRPGDLVWDVGAGSGALAVEVGRQGAAVIAVERDPVGCEHISANAARYGVEVQIVPGTAPDVLSRLPDPDTVFVGGGGADVVAACAARRPERMVAAVSALESVGPVHAALTGAGYAVEGTMLQSSRLTPASGAEHRLRPEEPVFVLWGDRL
ncbi:precorrin-6y C5,15-methyltransferase (decarboxylating) subunit CbiE [Yinghuangia seranimata]|uniref:precorrin-6y C5,15-methyltransferase (decarboxylating) subunit CbiE n=1 Tax=Yinghuangia seranimata TaxID=408067 RepID=UPI00248CBE63|nr:precorrin-6y C5,15-methyltransferase (decarboxylating) subunit CbiE [Yinghuangia seranimata]MDI2126703.1 precorrin-6y C5,15-methyltransferase (decarboxylating) subunit CbiE [Yinghuangia seranimata]